MAYLILNEHGRGENAGNEHYFEFDPNDAESVKMIEEALVIKKSYPQITNKKIGRIIEHASED